MLQAGAGAVGCALDYWLAVIGLAGEWTFADGDDVDVTNLNRQLLFTATHAGFPTGSPINKATAVADALGPAAVAHPGWVDTVAGVAERVYDLILPLANERGARVFLQSRAEPVLLHATTTPSWSATVHRHLAGRDGCIVCRLPAEEEPAFSCATAEVGARKKADASLPFLSAAAGALLLGDLARLQLGQLAERDRNYAILDLRSPLPRASSYDWPGCSTDCQIVVPAPARVALAKHTRWAHLDAAA